jgi:hypothetical protein
VNYDDGCVICQYNFVHSQSIVQLHCKHLFHYPCIRDVRNAHSSLLVASRTPLFSDSAVANPIFTVLGRSRPAHISLPIVCAGLRQLAFARTSRNNTRSSRRLGVSPITPHAPTKKNLRRFLPLEPLQPSSSIPFKTNTNLQSHSNEEVVDANWACEHPDIQDQDSAYWINENNKLLLSRHWNQEFGRTPRDVSCEMARVRQDRRRRNQLRREWVAREGTGIAGLDPAPAEGA